MYMFIYIYIYTDIKQDNPRDVCSALEFPKLERSFSLRLEAHLTPAAQELDQWIDQRLRVGASVATGRDEFVIRKSDKDSTNNLSNNN